MLKYFAYGSNMNPERMKTRQIFFTQRKRAILRGYRLDFNKIASRNPEEGYANIVEDESATVEGTLYDISDLDISKLDVYEGFPNNYDRIEVDVEIDSGDVNKAVTYVAAPDMIRQGLKPSRDYLCHLLAAKDIVSKTYYNRLKVWETLD